MSTNAIVEHRSSPRARQLTRNRLRLALGIAAVEGILVLAGVVPWWLVVLLAGAAVAAYWVAGREHPHESVRSAAWIAAVSQLTVVLVPVVAAVAVALAVLVVVLIAGVALAALLLDRR